MSTRYAWAGGGRKILRVDLTGDGGETWTQVGRTFSDHFSPPLNWRAVNDDDS